MKSRLLLLFCLLFVLTNTLHSQRIMERLNRGLVAVRVSSTQTFLSWRVLGYDPDHIAFNLYRNGVRINNTPISNSSNFMDNQYSATNVYMVRPVINGVETGESHEARVWTNHFLDIPLRVPAALTMPDGTSCTYSPNDCTVGDVDGDGDYEIFVKWDPSNARDNAHSGYTGNVYIDCYKLDGTFLWRIDLGVNIRAGAHYTQMVVADFDGDGRAELAVKTAPGTRDGSGNFISRGPAATAPHTTDFRNSGGYILTGPEYLTVFSGLTGLELATENYDPPRGTVSAWGDNYGNRVDRFLASAAWLDGVLPSIVMMRGYYTRAVVAAWDFRNGRLTRRWTHDSNTSNVGLHGQGFHSTSVADVNNNGRDDIVWGSAALNHNGALLYRTGHGHGDAMHVSDMDPDRPGLEVWSVKESAGSPFGFVLHDARTGEVIWGTRTGSDVGRGLAANLLPNNRGFEMWSTGSGGIFDVRGTQVSTSRPAINFRIYWTDDLQSELLDNVTISKFGVGNIFSAIDCASNNGTKATPNLSADILGDWREEVIFRTLDNTRLRIFTTTTITPHKMYTLMHDDVYRNAIIWQNTGYNQPPHAGFYIGADMDIPPASPVYNNEKRFRAGTIWDANTAIWTDSIGQNASFVPGDKVLFDLTAGGHANVALQGNINPQYVKVNSPHDVTLSGPGALTGPMYVRKTGAGRLTFNAQNTFTGNVTAWSGSVVNNGTLTSPDVSVWSFTTLGGSGRFTGNVTMGNNSTLFIGETSAQASSMRVGQHLTSEGRVTYHFDFQITNNQLTAHDTLFVGGNWTFSNRTTLNFNVLNGNLPVGTYSLIQVGGTINGILSTISIQGIPSNVSYFLFQEDGALKLTVKQPSALIWNGTVDARWDLNQTANWLHQNQAQTFITNDTVVFRDESLWKTLLVTSNVEPGAILFESSVNYSIGGTGIIGGRGGLIKNGTGSFILSGSNNFTGPIQLNEGTIQVSTLSNGGMASPLGASSSLSENFRFNGGRLHYTGNTRDIDRGFLLESRGGVFSINSSAASLNVNGRITGPGRLIKEGIGRLGLGVANNYQGGTLIRAGSINLLNDVANSNGLSTDTILLQGGNIVMFNSPTTSNTSNWRIHVPDGATGGITTDDNSTISGTITGGGVLNYITMLNTNLLTADVSEFRGILNVSTDADGGDFVVFNTRGYPRCRIHLNNLVRMIYRNTSNITIPIGELTGHAGSVLGAGGAAISTINWEVGGRNTNATFAGVINNSQFSGTGARARITKTGTGTWTLTNANTYTGGTAVNGGVLMVNNTTGSGLGTGDISVNAGGTLAGSGTIAGRITIQSGGVLSPGNGIGILTCDSDVVVSPGGVLELEINQGANNHDRIQVRGNFQMLGTLRVTTPEGFQFTPDAVIEFSTSSITGTPESLVPAFPPSNELLAWDLSEFSAGRLKVRATSTGLTDAEARYRVYPNPFSNRIELTLPQMEEKVQITLYDVNGQKVIQEEYSNVLTLLLQTGALPAGSYMLKINTNKEEIIKKLVKK